MATPTNEELINKTIQDDPDFNHGGRLNPEQQEAFIEIIKTRSSFLKEIRFETVTHKVTDLDRMWIGEPITYPVGENDGTAFNASPVFDKVRLEVRKLKSQWTITYEALSNNIEGEDLDDRVVNGMARKMADDLDKLAIQGDTSITSPSTPEQRLLSALDGFRVLTDDSHIVKAGGGGLSRSLLATAMRRMPQEYLQDPNLRWIMPRSLAIDWLEGVAARQTVGGDQALNGTAPIAPLGIPALVVPNIPANLVLNAGGAAPAVIEAEEFGPYTIVENANDHIYFATGSNPNGTALTADVTVVIPAGVYTASKLAAEIRRQLAALATTNTNAAILLSDVEFRDNGDGQLMMITVGTGASATLTLNNYGASNEIYPTLGIAANDVNDSQHDAAGRASGTINGTYMFLANPKNFIFGMRGNTRIYSDFDIDNDRIKTVTYNEVGVAIENEEAIVRIDEIATGNPTGI